MPRQRNRRLRLSGEDVELLEGLSDAGSRWFTVRLMERVRPILKLFPTKSYVAERVAIERLMDNILAAQRSEATLARYAIDTSAEIRNDGLWQKIPPDPERPDPLLKQLERALTFCTLALERFADPHLSRTPPSNRDLLATAERAMAWSSNVVRQLTAVATHDARHATDHPGGSYSDLFSGAPLLWGDGTDKELIAQAFEKWARRKLADQQRDIAASETTDKMGSPIIRSSRPTDDVLDALAAMKTRVAGFEDTAARLQTASDAFRESRQEGARALDDTAALREQYKEDLQAFNESTAKVARELDEELASAREVLSETSSDALRRTFEDLAKLHREREWGPLVAGISIIALGLLVPVYEWRATDGLEGDFDRMRLLLGVPVVTTLLSLGAWFVARSGYHRRTGDALTLRAAALATTTKLVGMESMDEDARVLLLTQGFGLAFSEPSTMKRKEAHPTLTAAEALKLVQGAKDTAK